MTSVATTVSATSSATLAFEMDPRRWIVLGLVLIGGFLAVVDSSILNVAVPSIREAKLRAAPKSAAA